MTTPDPHKFSPREMLQDMAANSTDQRVRFGAVKELQRVAEAGAWDVALPDDEYQYVYLRPEDEAAFRAREPGARAHVVASEDKHVPPGSIVIRHTPEDEDDGGDVTLFPGHPFKYDRDTGALVMPTPEEADAHLARREEEVRAYEEDFAARLEAGRPGNRPSAPEPEPEPAPTADVVAPEPEPEFTAVYAPRPEGS